MPGFLLGQFYHFFITSDNSVSVHHYWGQFGVSSSLLGGQFGVSSSLLGTIRYWDNSGGQFGVSSSLSDNSVSVHHYCFPCIKSVSWIHGKGDNSVSVHHYCGDNSVSVHHYRGQFGIGTIRCQFIIIGQFGVSSSLLLPLHQVGKLDSWEEFQDRQAMTLFTTRSTAGTTEPMSSAPTANGIYSLAISPAPRHGILSRSSATV